MKDYTEKVNQIRELKRMQEEISAEIAALEDEIKADMAAEGAEEFRGTAYKITWKPYTQSRIDSKALKAELPDIAERFTKVTQYKRFLIA